MYEADFIFETIRKKFNSDLIDAWVGREGAGRLCKIVFVHFHRCSAQQQLQEFMRMKLVAS